MPGKDRGITEICRVLRESAVREVGVSQPDVRIVPPGDKVKRHEPSVRGKKLLHRQRRDSLGGADFNDELWLQHVNRGGEQAVMLPGPGRSEADVFASVCRPREYVGHIDGTSTINQT